MNNTNNSLIEGLFRETSVEVRNFFRRRVAIPEDANDLTQEVYFRFQRAGYTASGPEARALLFQIAKNLLRDQTRLQIRERELGYDPRRNIDIIGQNHIAADQLSPEQAALVESELLQVIQAIENLPRKCRQAIILFRFQGMLQKEIAVKMGISQRMVEKHLAQAMKRLERVIRFG